MYCRSDCVSYTVLCRPRAHIRGAVGLVIQGQTRYTGLYSLYKALTVVRFIRICHLGCQGGSQAPRARASSPDLARARSSSPDLARARSGFIGQPELSELSAHPSSMYVCGGRRLCIGVYVDARMPPQLSKPRGLLQPHAVTLDCCVYNVVQSAWPLTTHCGFLGRTGTGAGAGTVLYI